MTRLTNDPRELLERMRGELDTAFGTTRPPVGDDESNVVTSSWAPAVDIHENANSYVLKADLPGIDPNQIEVMVENGRLSIKGERRTESAEDASNFRRIERAYGIFYRRFSLPETANTDRIKASVNHGVLTVQIPKQERAQPRRINVDL